MFGLRQLWINFDKSLWQVPYDPFEMYKLISVNLVSLTDIKLIKREIKGDLVSWTDDLIVKICLMWLLLTIYTC